jgi:hypothetical protein
MSKILALFASLWHLIENKTVFVGIVTAVGSIGAFYGLNVPVSMIITGATAIMVGLGISGWQTTTATTQETVLKTKLLDMGVKHTDLHDAFLCSMGRSKAPVAPSAQKGAINIKLLSAFAIVGLVAFGSFFALSSTGGCAASNALGSCEVSVLDKQLPNSAGTIATDLITAVAEGGSTVPALLASIDSVYPGTLACLGTFVDTLISTYLNAGGGSAAGSGSAIALEAKPRLVIADPGKAREGLAVLHSELRKRGLPVVTTAVP